MPLKIRLARRGTKKRPYYHIVVAEAEAPRDGVEVNDRIKMQHLHDDDAQHALLTEPVGRMHRIHEAEIDQEAVQRTRLTQHGLDADGTDERRQDHRHEHERIEQRTARKRKAHITNCQRQRVTLQKH